MRINRTLEDAEFKHIPVIACDRLIMNTDALSLGVIPALYAAKND